MKLSFNLKGLEASDISIGECSVDLELDVKEITEHAKTVIDFFNDLSSESKSEVKSKVNPETKRSKYDIDDILNSL